MRHSYTCAAALTLAALTLASLMLASLSATAVRAQIPFDARHVEARVETVLDPELRGVGAWHAELGASVRTGFYARIAALAGGGVRRVRGTWRESGRVDVIGRFQLDPMYERSWGLYVGAGGTAFFDRGLPGRVRAALIVGTRAGSAKAAMKTIEVGIGGGVRVAVALEWPLGHSK